MALQLLGLQRCPACATSEIVWKCSVCDNAVRSEDLGDDHDGISMPGLRCAACGEARELSSFVIPESLTDFWVHEFRSAEKLRKVKFSDELGRPTALYFRQRVVGVEEIVFFLRVREDRPSAGPAPYGAYLLRTELGLCVVVCAPHELGEGELNPMIADWYLVEVDDTMRETLQGRSGAATGSTQNGDGTPADEGLLSNAFAYKIMYRIENSLRRLLAHRLSEKADGRGNWWGAVVPQGIRDYVSGAQTRRQESAWFEVPPGEPISFATLGQLRELLDSDWAYLGRGLAPKEITLGALRKIEFYRNELAHCRPLTLRMLSELHEVKRSLDRVVSMGSS